MLILILIDVLYLQNVAFSFEKGLNVQNRSSSGSHLLMKKSYPLTLFGKPCYVSDLSKLETLLYKTHNKVLLVLWHQGSTCVDP